MTKTTRRPAGRRTAAAHVSVALLGETGTRFDYVLRTQQQRPGAIAWTDRDEDLDR